MCVCLCLRAGFSENVRAGNASIHRQSQHPRAYLKYTAELLSIGRNAHVQQLCDVLKHICYRRNILETSLYMRSLELTDIAVNAVILIF